MKDGTFIDVCRDFIDITNAHVGTYVDACAGFAGNSVRVERQVAKVLHSQRQKLSPKDGTVIVFASFEDPDHPDAIHHRIIAAKDFISANGEAGSNAQLHAASAVIFIFAKWDEVIRPRLAIAKGVSPNDITLDIMGDLRLIRHAILHNDGTLSVASHSKIKRLSDIIPPGKLNLSNAIMHVIFAQVKMGFAELICRQLGLPFTDTGPDAIKEIVVQRTASKHQFRPAG